MARKKRTPAVRRIPPKEVARFTSNRLELLEVIHDMVRLEVDKQLKDVPVRRKPPSAQHTEPSKPQK